MSAWRPKSIIKEIVIHCAATPNGRETTVEDIDHWHGPDREARGLRPFNRDYKKFKWTSPKLHHIGYHFVIYTGGCIVTGRQEDETGAHAGNPWNKTSIAICMIGMDKFSVEQWDTLRLNVISLQNRYPTIERVMAHHEINKKKSCPGFSVKAWLANDMQPLPEHIHEAPK